MALVHSRRYLRFLEVHQPQPGKIYRIDDDTVMCHHSLKAASFAAGAVVQAVDMVMNQKAWHAFCAVRPPGHHAQSDQAGGFCLINNAAVGVMHAIAEYRLQRVAVIDFDVHHGDGTTEIFQDDPRVLLMDAFETDLFPFPDFSSQTGRNPHMLHTPFASGTDSRTFRDVVRTQWLPKLAEFKPELVIFCANRRHSLLFHVEGTRPLSQVDTYLLNLFTESVIVALENIRLNELLADNQREIIYRIGEIVETRSKESGLHVKRVALYCELLARLLGLSEHKTELMKLASPLHDIGKIGIPDAVLHKPGKLDPDEWNIMMTHSQLGYDMLQGSDIELFQVASEIARNHHEKWDGSGYPRGLKEDAIPLEGRITALVDVFDALGSDRCYKKAWPLDKILELIKSERGRHFDPVLVDLMLANLDAFLAIRDTYKDEFQGD